MKPILIGLMAGLCSGLFGIGGGVVIVPMLLYFYGLKQQSATATSLVALLLPVGLLGVWQYYQSGFLQKENFVIGGLIALGMLFGTLAGSRVAVHLSSAVLTKMFAIFLFFVAIRLWMSAK